VLETERTEFVATVPKERIMLKMAKTRGPVTTCLRCNTTYRGEDECPFCRLPNGGREGRRRYREQRKV